MTEPGYDDLRSALSNSHDRLAAVLAALTPEQAGEQSYDDDWSIGQVASHLGSGAEIFALFLDAGLQNTAAPGSGEIQPIWARWDAKSAAEQTRDVVPTDRSFLDRLATVSADDIAGWELDLFGSTQDLPGLLRMRLSEHAVHTWDIAVAIDPSATLADDATALLVDTLPGVAARAGKPSEHPVRVRVVTSAPEREFVLELSADGARLEGAGDGDTELRTPAEAFVRLLYGRLDADHTPASVESSVDLDVLRSVFPGF